MSEDGERSYSIWGILAVLVVLGVVGMFLLFTGGADETSSTRRLANDPSTTTTSTTTSSTVPMAFPDGTPLPERVEKATSEPGQATYTYRLPAGFTDRATKSVIAPALAAPANDGAAVSISMACAVSDGSVPAQIIVTEDPIEVRVIPVAIGASLGAPCPGGQTIESIVIPLQQPIGTRELVVAPAGSVVNLPGS